MRIWSQRFIAALSTSLLLAAPARAQLQSKTLSRQEQANVKLALDWWHDIVQGKKLGAAEKYMPADFVSRNSNIAAGRDAFVKAVTDTPAALPNRNLAKPAVIVAKGDYVALVWEQKEKDPTNPSQMVGYNTLDLVRVQNGKIVEHWDNTAKLGKTPTYPKPEPVYNANFTLSAAEQRTLDVGTKEFKDMLQYGHVELANQYMAPGYIQHNPNVPPGRDGFIKNFSSRKPEPIQAAWKTPPTLTLVSGNLVLFFGTRTAKDPADESKTYPTYRFDMVRVDDGLIQEHWDVARKNPPAPPATAAPAP